MSKDVADKISLETMIFQVGSKIVTHKPAANGNSDVEEVEGENDSLNQRTPRQQNVKQSKANTSEEPLAYETPVILREKPWAPSVVQDNDTDEEDSEIERLVIAMRKKAAKVSSDRQLDSEPCLMIMRCLFHI